MPGPSPDLAGFNERLSSKMLSNWLWRKSDFSIFKPLADFRSLTGVTCFLLDRHVLMEEIREDW